MRPFPAGKTTPEIKQDLPPEEITARMELERKYIELIPEAIQEQVIKSLRGLSADEVFELQQRLDENGEDLLKTLEDMRSAAATLGVEAAVKQFDSIAIGFDFNLANSAAVQQALAGVNNLYLGINNTTANQLSTSIQSWIDAGGTMPQLRREIADFIATGKPFSDLISNLANVVGPDRGLTIASTEVTRAYAEGNETSWETVARENNIQIEKKWVTQADENVCPICSRLGGMRFSVDGAERTSIDQQRRDAQTAELGQPFTHPGGRGAAGQFEGQTYLRPPAHPRCRCELVPVVV